MPYLADQIRVNHRNIYSTKSYDFNKCEDVLQKILDNQQFIETVRVTMDLMKDYRGLDWIIAGGFLRDIVLGVTPSDVDLYVGYKGELPENFEKHTGDGKGTSAEGSSIIKDVYQGKYQGVEYDIMTFDKPRSMREATEKVLLSFDYGICRIAYSIGNGFMVTEDFRDDVVNQTLTCLRPEATLKHKEKLMNKFPTYKHVDIDLDF